MFHIQLVTDLAAGDCFGKPAHDPPKAARLLIGLRPLNFTDDRMHAHDIVALGGTAAFQKWQQRLFKTLAQGDVIDNLRRRFRQRQFRPDRQAWKKQIGRMDSLGAAHRQQRLVVREQAYRLMRRACQQFFQIFNQGLIGVFNRLRHRSIERQLAGIDPVEQVFYGFGQDRHAIDIDDLQRTVRLMQMGLGLM